MDEADKPEVMQRQRALLEQRYDLSDRPMQGVMMSGGRKSVQDGVRVRLPENTTWGDLAAMSPGEIRAQGLLPEGFKPLPHVKQATGGQVFPNEAIDEIRSQERRDLRRFDVEMDLPEHLRPEFPPPIFLTSHPELGDISRGELLTIRNFYELTVGLISPVPTFPICRLLKAYLASLQRGRQGCEGRNEPRGCAEPRFSGGRPGFRQRSAVFGH